MSSTVKFEASRGEAADGLLARERASRRRTALQVASVLAVVAACCFIAGLFDLPRLFAGLEAIAVLLAESLPPDFSRWRHWITPLVDTVSMSVAGTALAVVISLPLGFLAARNTSPHPAVYQAARIFLNAVRAIPELIMGIVFVAAVGFGMLPGVLALGLHSVGMVGKFFAEIIEHAHPAPIEAARATGASPVQIVTHGVMPQVFPQFADVTMYRWEYNFRASTVMGMVGAGGIGTELMGALRILEYHQVSALLLVILATVTLVDWMSGRLRRSFQ
ncbi:MAG: phosphonate ABC transporter, permease protein PhnE [Alphaproteobacteria bacterium]|nr:phosphonate ABC transporter, permease protein PhnE [Alphaproteobacteria bacterium]